MGSGTRQEVLSARFVPGPVFVLLLGGPVSTLYIRKSSSKKVKYWGFPGGSVVKNPPANAGDTGLIPESGRPSGEGNGNLLQCSRLGNPMNRGAWWATVCRVAIVRQDLKTKQHKRELPREVRKRLPLPVRMKKGRGDCCPSSQ